MRTVERRRAGDRQVDGMRVRGGEQGQRRHHEPQRHRHRRHAASRVPAGWRASGYLGVRARVRHHLVIGGRAGVRERAEAPVDGWRSVLGVQRPGARAPESAARVQTFFR